MDNSCHDVLVVMLENIIGLWAYPALGFAVTYLAMEVAWHCVACRTHSKEIKPCLFKQVKEIAVGHH
jgi:hypothetical protein